MTWLLPLQMRHMRSLRSMRRDNGWIHTLLEEAENERMVSLSEFSDSSTVAAMMAGVTNLFIASMQLLRYISAASFEGPVSRCSPAQSISQCRMLLASRYQACRRCERLCCAVQHLLTFLELKQPGPLLRGFVLLTQGIFFNLYFLYASPTPCLTYAHI